MRVDIGIATVVLIAAALIAGAALYRRRRAKPEIASDRLDDEGAPTATEEAWAEATPAPV